MGGKKEIEAAKVALKHFVENKPWFNGIGVGLKNGSLRIHVYSTDKSAEVVNTIPAEFRGFPVAVFYVRMPKAQ